MAVSEWGIALEQKIESVEQDEWNTWKKASCRVRRGLTWVHKIVIHSMQRDQHVGRNGDG